MCCGHKQGGALMHQWSRQRSRLVDTTSEKQQQYQQQWQGQWASLSPWLTLFQHPTAQHPRPQSRRANPHPSSKLTLPPHSQIPNPNSPTPHPRYKLGLYQPPLSPLELEPGQEQEWIELKPRWPLTSEKHSGSMPPTRSSKTKLARSLTEETREELAAVRGAGGGAGTGAGTAACDAADPGAAASAATAAPV